MKKCSVLKAFIALACFVIFVPTSMADVVINEVFYHSPDDLDLEYIELFNSGSETVDLSGWKLTKGVKFTFPDGTKLSGGAFAVVAKDAALLKEFYKIDAIGQFKKSLSNSSDEIRLKDANDKKIESVEYRDQAPWPISADGYSASLERISPAGPANDPSNWAPSILSKDYDKYPSGTPGQRNSVFAAATPPKIGSVTWHPKQPKPRQQIVVTLNTKKDSIKSAAVHYRVVAPGSVGEEQVAAMEHTNGKQLTARIPTGDEANRLLRFRIVAQGANGGVANSPALNEIRPAYTAYVNDAVEADHIPVIQFFHVEKSVFDAGEQYRREQARPQSRGRRGFGGFFGAERRPRELSPEERLRREAESQVRALSLVPLWSDLTLKSDRDSDSILRLREPFRSAESMLTKLRGELPRSGSVKEYTESLPQRIDAIRSALKSKTESVLSKEEQRAIDSFGQNGPANRSRGPGPGFSSILSRILNIEENWHRLAVSSNTDEKKLVALARIHREFLSKRDDIKLDGSQDMRDVFDQVRTLEGNFRGQIAKELGESDPESRDDQFAQRGFDRRGRGGFPGGRRGPGRGGFPGFRRGSRPATPLLPQGPSAVVYTDPKTGKSEVFDFVNVVERKSGWKARFHKDRPLLGMTTINFLYEPNEATILNESIAYELYRFAGNKSYLNGYMRLIVNGKPAGYHLYFEQPNGNFFRRNEIDNNGDLYKLIWMGNAEVSERIPASERPKRQDIAGRHEKKTNRHQGYQDLVELIEKFEQSQSDEETWSIIEENIDVENMVNYFAVNSLLSHWDGFFNNYFVYFDREGTGKWSIFPWDQDSTLSQRGGRPEELYEMPLFFGAEGATPQGIDRTERQQRAGNRRRGGFGFGGFGGPGRGRGWWRPGGDFSRPMLANPKFYSRFIRRMKELTDADLAVKTFDPKIDLLRTTLEPEVRLRARLRGGDEQDAVDELNRTTDSIREHLVRRSQFVRQAIAQGDHGGLKLAN